MFKSLGALRFCLPGVGFAGVEGEEFLLVDPDTGAPVATNSEVSRHGDKWEMGFNQLLHYVESNGDARVPRKYSIDGYQLGDWVTTQRQKHAKGTLDADREHRLQDVPGWTWKASSST